MPAYPNYYYSENGSNDRTIIDQMEENWTSHSRQNLYFQGQADLDVRFYIGDQKVFSDIYGPSMPFARQNFTVNLIKRLVEMPVGYQLENRKSITAIPIEGSDQLTSDQFTKIFMWNDRQAGLDDIFSDAFKSSAIAGLSWVNGYMDYTSDPVSGDIMASVDRYNEVIFDPFFTRIDMSDCDFWWKRSYITKANAYALLPGYEKLVDMMNPIGTKVNLDGKFQYTPQSIFYNSNKLLTYDEYWYRSYRKQKLLLNEENGTYLEWHNDDKSLREYREYVSNEFPNADIRVVENTIPTVRRAIVLNGIVVTDEGQPYGLDTYATVPVMAYYTPESSSLVNKISGIVRAARDPQFLFNKFLLSTMDTVDAQPHSGFIATADSVVNPKSLFKTGPGQVIWRKKGTTVDDVIKIQPPAPPLAQMQITETLQKLMIDTTGANETNLGLSDDKVAGVLNMLNQRAGLTALNSLFDNLDRSMKQFARIRMQLIQRNFVPEKVKRILNEEPSQQFYERAFGKYDVVIADGYNTSTQRQLAFAQALKLKEIIPEIPGSYLISKSTLQDKNDLVKILQQQEQAQAQMQQAQSQVIMQEQKATIDMANAQAAYQTAGAQERKSRILENFSLANEREAAADKDRETALLNKVKTLKELEEMDLSHIERLVNLARALKEKEMGAQQSGAQGVGTVLPQAEMPPAGDVNQQRL